MPLSRYPRIILTLHINQNFAEVQQITQIVPWKKAPRLFLDKFVSRKPFPDHPWTHHSQCISVMKERFGISNFQPNAFGETKIECPPVLDYQAISWADFSQLSSLLLHWKFSTFSRWAILSQMSSTGRPFGWKSLRQSIGRKKQSPLTSLRLSSFVSGQGSQPRRETW